MEEDYIPELNPDFFLESIDNEILLYHPAKTNTFYLNETASLVWNMCDGKRKIADIIFLLEQSYPEEGNQISKDVIQTIERFVEHGAITLKES